MSDLEDKTDLQQEAITPIVLGDIYIDTNLKRNRFQNDLNVFLQENIVELGLAGEDLIEAYFELILPSELRTSMIMSSASFDEHDRWIIRPAADGPQAETFAVNGFVPAFSAYRKKANLIIDGFAIVPHIQPRGFERYVTGEVHFNADGKYMSKADFELLNTLARPRRLAADQLAKLQGCLSWKQRLVSIGQHILKYSGWQKTGSGQIRFIAQNLNTKRPNPPRPGMSIVSAKLSDSQSDQQWEPDPEIRPDFIRLGDIAAVESLGSGSDNRLVITISPAPELDDQFIQELSELPQEGFLLSAIGGDLKPINNERNAARRLLMGRHHNLYLPDYMFDISNAALPGQSCQIPEDHPLFEKLNAEQKAAVRKTIAAPDIALLQGPPGTGKTTVIVTYIVLEVSQGRRILLSSQTNIAVDNVLSKLSKDPAIRPIRLARADRINKEHRQFLEGNVLEPWFKAITGVCGKSIERREKNLADIKTAQDAFDVLENVLKKARQTTRQLSSRQAENKRLQDEYQHLTGQRKNASETLDGLQKQKAVLDDLAVFPDTKELNLESLKLLPGSQPADAAYEAIQQLCAAAGETECIPRWLVNHEQDNPGNYFVILSMAQKAVEAANKLKPLLKDATSLCRGSSGQDCTHQSAQLRELISQRSTLIESDNEDDLLKLVKINRSIKQLRSGRWSAVCQKINTYAQILFQNDLPGPLDELVSSLNPGADQIIAIDECLMLCDLLSGKCDEILTTGIGQIRTAAEKDLLLLCQQIDKQQDKYNQKKTQAEKIRFAIEDIDSQIEEINTYLAEYQQVWEDRWPDVCPDIQFDQNSISEINDAAFQKRRNDFSNWLNSNKEQTQRDVKWLGIQQEWVDLLHQPQTARQKDVKRMYAENANVVGITCYEAGQRSFYDSDDFRAFDSVVIDEVSKCTITELLMPVMLGKKTVLVGDHRQLPPMFKERESSFEEAVEEGLIKSEDFQRYEKLITASYFEQLFESAPDCLRQMLYREYRSHSQIMEVYNQFYDGKLIAAGGKEELDKLRQHHLTIRDARGGKFLEPHQHVLWIDSTKTPEGRLFYEKQVGSSKVNVLEVRLITASLIRFNKALKQKGYGPVINAEAASDQKGVKLGKWVKKCLPAMTSETEADIFSRGQVRINGQTAASDQLIETGDLLELDARMPVGVITFYGAQLGRIRREINKITSAHPKQLNVLNIYCNTVDRFQGMEMPIILVSLVRSPRNNNVGKFVKQYHRINVAFSRAQNLLVIIGSQRTFNKVRVPLPDMDDGTVRQVPVYRNIYDIVTKYGGRRYARELIQ